MSENKNEKIKIYSYRNVIIKLLQTFSFMFGDSLYIKLLFKYRTGYRLNLKEPTTYNEKLQWLKLNYRKEEMTSLVDKYLVKDIVAKEIGEEYIIPTLGVWEDFDEINFDLLPNKFVLKTTHDQGGVVVCTDKSKFNIDKAKAKLNKHLKRNFYLLFREWPYKNVKPRIIAEEFIGNPNENTDLKDYKFYCFNGKAKLLFIASGRNTSQTKFDFYDIEFNHLDIRRPNTIQSKEGNKKPENYDKMLQMAEQLAGDFPHVRVDFYNIKGEIYFGELTFYTGSGMKAFYPHKWDEILGSYIELPNN